MIYVSIHSFSALLCSFHYLFIILFFCNYLLFLLNSFFEMPKIIISFYCHKLHTKYFHVSQFFIEQQYFLRKVQKTVAAAHLTISSLKETFVSEIRYRIFCYLASFLKKIVFSKKNVKNHHRGIVS